ncbi:PREDICTED: cholesterol 7-desaturase-like isoform X2 [Cyphomyrmex costatus]|uniref:cholesterol 7-desaturase n=1 Tax=Cyphomyrmex costatus TaxID=456900 RepID=A0A151I912_9HYME|nr:PREDICTED: cholesterol 7-desaturase-like isoform X2 [Cyphomyrmex costatus]KYM95135.1 3-chlorobenzoate-3,4-dioxygenase oxygenase subunit [Cyphomyrmex costatus]
MLTMLEWCIGIVTILMIILIYFAYIFKFNWVNDLRTEIKTRSFYESNKNRKVGKELPPVYPNGWFALLESSQIKSGQVKHVSALGENFAVFRTEKGVVNILDAYCPHLGANMAENGRVKGDCLECPFHSWTFRGDNGYCENIPYTTKVPHVARVKVWKSCEVNNIIFVWYHSESAEPDWQPQSRTCISNRSWRHQGRNEYLINCHIQDITENGPDATHLNPLHGPVSLSGQFSWLVRHVWITRTKWRPNCPDDNQADEDEEAVEMSTKMNDVTIHSIKNVNGNRHFTDAQNRDRREKHKATVRLCHKLMILERFSILESDVLAEINGPGIIELNIKTSFGSLFILLTITPIEPLLQRVIHYIYSPLLLAPYASLLFVGERVMFERDVMIWNTKRFERHPLLMPEDRNIQVYRRWYSQFYSEHSPTYETTIKDLQW